MSTGIRISFEAADKLLERSQQMPYGMRSGVCRELLAAALDLGEQHGAGIYGAIIGGHFELEVTLPGD